MEPIFTGAIHDTPDPRDYKLEEIAFASSPFDWNKGYDIETQLSVTIPAKDQGTSYSCGGQAFSYLEGVLEARETGTYKEKSAKFPYTQVFVAGGGSAGRPLADLYIKKGASSESLCLSYDAGNPPDEDFMQRGNITPEAFTDALTSLGGSYATPNLDIDSLAQAIRDHHGVVFGITGSNNGTWRTVFPQAPMKGDTLWSHWVYAGKAKMINGVKHISILNSWGKNTGENGWQWLPETYLTYPNLWATWTLIKKLPTVETPYHIFTHVLVYGTTSQEVTYLQQKLQKLGFFPGNINCSGYFGDITARSLQKFQIANNITDFAQETDLKKIRFGNKSILVINKN